MSFSISDQGSREGTTVVTVMKRLEETAKRNGTTVEALVSEMAENIVTRWESIPEIVAQFRSHHPELTDEGARSWEATLREIMGGEEVYLASKRFLEG